MSNPQFPFPFPFPLPRHFHFPRPEEAVQTPPLLQPPSTPRQIPEPGPDLWLHHHPRHCHRCREAPQGRLGPHETPPERPESVGRLPWEASLHPSYRHRCSHPLEPVPRRLERPRAFLASEKMHREEAWAHHREGTPLLLLRRRRRRRHAAHSPGPHEHAPPPCRQAGGNEIHPDRPSAAAAAGCDGWHYGRVRRPPHPPRRGCPPLPPHHGGWHDRCCHCCCCHYWHRWEIHPLPPRS
mmetsp:Transcript_35586/g.60534  ORF Transcript_35586/g.60534 Transcript_35586/m.60534 type:complete len:239 (-) Transcript_35586:238-954(-)